MDHAGREVGPADWIGRDSPSQKGVNDRDKEQRQGGRNDQTADHDEPDVAAAGGAGSRGQRQGESSQDGRSRRHDDGAQAKHVPSRVGTVSFGASQ